MQLILGATPHSGCRRLDPVIKALGRDVVDVGTPEQWEGAATNPLEVGDDELLLLCHTRPEYAVARAMEEGRMPSEGLASWREAAEAIMRAFRRRREKTVVVDAALAAREPKAFVEACAARFDIRATTPPIPAAGDLEYGQADDFRSLIATQVVSQDPAIPDLLRELEAASVPLGESDEPPRLDGDRLWSAYQDLQEARGQELQDVREENELLLLQLHQVQEELESYYLEFKGGQKRADEQKKRADEQKKRADARKKRINQIRRSTSWRITMPLRVLKRLATGNALRGRRKTSSKMKAVPPSGN